MSRRQIRLLYPQARIEQTANRARAGLSRLRRHILYGLITKEEGKAQGAKLLEDLFWKQVEDINEWNRRKGAPGNVSGNEKDMRASLEEKLSEWEAIVDDI